MLQPDPPSLWSFLRRPLLTGVGTGVLGLLLSFLMADVYHTEVIILPKANVGPLAALAATATILGAGGGFGQFDEEAHYVDIVRSRWMAEQLLDTQYRFRYRSWRFGAYQQRDQTLNQFLKAGNAKERDRAIQTVQDWVDCKRDFNSNTLHLQAEAPSAELAQQLADQATALLNGALRNRLQTQAAAKTSYAKVLVDQARREEEQARQALEGFARGHINFASSPDPGVRTRGEALSAERDLRRQVLTTLALAYEQAQLEANNTAPVLSLLAPAYQPLVRYGPSRVKIALLALLGGFLLQLAWDRRFKILTQALGCAPTKLPEHQRLLDHG